MGLVVGGHDGGRGEMGLVVGGHDGGGGGRAAWCCSCSRFRQGDPSDKLI